MKANFAEKIAAVLKKHRALSNAMGEDLPQDERTKKGQELAEIEPILPIAKRWQALGHELAELKELMGDEDPEVMVLAEQDLSRVQIELAQTEGELKRALLPKDRDDRRDVIVEIRPGTGGDEAALFAERLLGMYRRFAEIIGMRMETISLNQTELGGVQQVVFSLRGHNAFGIMKYESGVHRVQRVPKTESSGRIHTSAATVAVLPEVEEVEVEVRDQDIRIDTFRAQGAGGQHVNTTDSAVRITHLPTNVVVSCQDEKSQHKNRAKAMKVLRARLYDLERQNRDSERASMRRGQVGGGDRSERIRTYNFPQSRVTDHRIGLTVHKLEQVLSGDALGEIIDQLRIEDEASQLASIE